MCRNIRTLFNFEPPATDEEIRAACLQFVRKLSGFNAPSKVNEAAFHRAVDEAFHVARRLVDSLVTTAPNVLVVHPSVEAETVQQLVALAKANPNKLSYASQGVGTTMHLSPELLKSLTGINIVHVPYKGGAPALTDLMGGQVQIMFTEISGVLPWIRAGRLRALAVGSAKRTASLPNVPAISETLPGFVSISWQGMVAPPATPAPIADTLSAAIAEALKDPEMAKQIAQSSLDPIGSTPAELAAFIKEERERWGKVIRATGAKAE